MIVFSEHVVIHVPYHVHTVHHHHVKKVHVPVPVVKKVYIHEEHHEPIHHHEPIIEHGVTRIPKSLLLSPSMRESARHHSDASFVVPQPYIILFNAVHRVYSIELSFSCDSFRMESFIILVRNDEFDI
ncbi:hypothetical protein JTB14_010401 [Gonioctena quinquepunctata]|nr:hypothetical protein JTB14_010401 [Gonioctena quinquepunctata]